jgi:hypothetical protein
MLVRVGVGVGFFSGIGRLIGLTCHGGDEEREEKGSSHGESLIDVGQSVAWELNKVNL